MASLPLSPSVQDRAGRLRSVSSAPSSRAEQLCEQHGPALYFCALLIAGDHERALDAAASSLVSAGTSRTLESVVDRMEARRHLARLVFRECRQSTSAAARPSGGTEASFDELMTRLASINRHQRDVLALCVYGGHSASQAGVVLGFSADTTHHFLTWALRDLAQPVDGDRMFHDVATRPASTRPTLELLQ